MEQLPSWDSLIYGNHRYELYRYGTGKVAKLYMEDHNRDMIRKDYENAKSAVILGASSMHVYEYIQYNHRFGYLCDLRTGASLLDYLSQNPDQMNECLLYLAEELWRIHQIRSFLPGTVSDRYINTTKYNSFLNETEKYYLLDYISSLPQDTMLCYGFTSPVHILYDKNRHCLYDWSSCLCGHPLYDIARLSLLIRYYNVSSSSPLTKEDAMERLLLASAYFSDYYCSISGTNKELVSTFTAPAMADILYDYDLPLRKTEMLYHLKGMIRNAIQSPISR